jgi:hypothetical protein
VSSMCCCHISSKELQLHAEHAHVLTPCSVAMQYFTLPYHVSLSSGCMIS